METTFLTGIIGSVILVAGAAYPVKTVKHPALSTKNWLFAIGGLVMLAFAIMNYFEGGPIFFVILQILVNISSLLMMLNTPDCFDVPVLSISSIALIIWALTLFEDYATVIFILGLCGIGIGYALDTGTFRRNMALTIGSVLIAWFSYITATWIFFWLNAFFAVFSGYYAWKLSRLRPS